MVFMVKGQKELLNYQRAKTSRSTNQMKTTRGAGKAHAALSGSSFINRG